MTIKCVVEKPYKINGMVWYGNNLFDITETHNT